MSRPECGRFRCFGVGIAVLFTLAWAAPAAGQLSPGPLSKAHADLEGVENCTQCHKVAQKVTADKCLACHTALAQRIADRKGLHAEPGYDVCEKCHVEHQGRDYELTWWGKEGRSGFVHSRTGWALEGRHRGLSCERCHRSALIHDLDGLRARGANPERTHLGLRTTCASCHPDPHAGQLGAECGRCHGSETWQPAERFDHSQSRFALTGMHKEVACPRCHPASPGGGEVAGEPSAQVSPANKVRRQWTGLRFANCADCHQDPHRGQLGVQCTGCHVVEGWREVVSGRFDHDRTSYPLRGRHLTVPCRSCHRGSRERGNLQFALCSDCHADQHRGQFSQTAGGGDCAQCHTVEGFTPSTYDVVSHARSAYPLLGAHLAVPCIGCHARSNAQAPASEIPFRFSSTRCPACHQDPHRGEADRWNEEGGCESCHSPEAWTASAYDHGATRFPLTDRHARTPCSDCHRAGEVQTGEVSLKLQGLDTACASCHRDPHSGQFRTVAEVTRCERCHAPAGWRPALFDHNRDASFQLDGAHQKVPCAQCHQREGVGDAAFVRYKIADHSCAACHDQDADTTLPATEEPEGRPR